jgi:hypothetical protein
VEQQSLTLERPPEPRTPRSGWTAGPVVALVCGLLLAFVGLGALLAGAGLGVVHRAVRDDGYVMTGRADASSLGYAVVLDDVRFDGWTGNGNGSGWGMRGGMGARMLGTVRLTVTGTDPATPVFVGIARSVDAQAYLAGVAHSVVTPLEGGRSEVAGGPPAQPPADVSIWVAQRSGTGTQQLDWTPTGGSWTAVVMNADGTAGVSSVVRAGATAPVLPWMAWVLVAVGLVLLIGAAVVIVLASLRGTRPQRRAGRTPASPAG